jgi:LmbE family N-acetylglucosaminyl deacetylase
MIFQEIPESAMMIYAHPDDGETACGATVAKWTKAGCLVYSVVCAKGEKAQRVNSDMFLKRKKEAQEAAKILGLKDIEFLNYPDGEIENTVNFRKELVKLIRLYKPQIVFCPDPTAVFFGDFYYNHVDHRNTGWAVLDACFPAAGSQGYYPELGPPHKVDFALLSGTMHANVWIDVAGYLDYKIAALKKHRTVVGEDESWLKDQVTYNARTEGELCGLSYAEGFRRVGFVG